MGWINFDDIFDYTFEEGNFYIVMWQLGSSPNVAPVGVGIQMYRPVYRSYGKKQ